MAEPVVIAASAEGSGPELKRQKLGDDLTVDDGGEYDGDEAVYDDGQVEYGLADADDADQWAQDGGEAAEFSYDSAAAGYPGDEDSYGGADGVGPGAAELANGTAIAVGYDDDVDDTVADGEDPDGEEEEEDHGGEEDDEDHGGEEVVDEEDVEDEEDEVVDDEDEEDEDDEESDMITPNRVIWFDLSGEQRSAAQELGTREQWDNCDRTEATDDYWHQLTEEQQAAAGVRYP
jgi:hypothetical protein